MAVYAAREATQWAWRSRSRLLWWIVVATTAFYHNILPQHCSRCHNSVVADQGHHSPLVTTTKLPIISVIGNAVLVLGRKTGWVTCQDDVMTLDRNTDGTLLQTRIDAGTGPVQECWWGYFILLWKCCLNHTTPLSLSVYLCLITTLQGISTYPYYTLTGTPRIGR